MSTFRKIYNDTQATEHKFKALAESYFAPVETVVAILNGYRKSTTEKNIDGDSVSGDYQNPELFTASFAVKHRTDSREPGTNIGNLELQRSAGNLEDFTPAELLARRDFVSKLIEKFKPEYAEAFDRDGTNKIKKDAFDQALRKIDAIQELTEAYALGETAVRKSRVRHAAPVPQVA